VAVLDTPDGSFPLSGVLKAKQRIHYKAHRGQIVAQKWPRKRGSPTSPLQAAWVQRFKTYAQASKTPIPEDFCTASQLAKGTGWYYRDVLERAMSGKLFRDEGEVKITTPTVSVSYSLTQGLPGSPPLLLLIDTVQWDNNVFWDPLNPSRLTVLTTGLYLVMSTVRFDTIVSGERYLFQQIKLNGGDFVMSHSIASDSSHIWDNQFVGLWYFNANDYIEVYANRGGGTGNGHLSNLTLLAITPESII